MIGLESIKSINTPAILTSCTWGHYVFITYILFISNVIVGSIIRNLERTYRTHERYSHYIYLSQNFLE